MARGLLGNVVTGCPGRSVPRASALTAQEVGGNGRGLGAGYRAGTPGPVEQEGVDKLRDGTPWPVVVRTRTPLPGPVADAMGPAWRQGLGTTGAKGGTLHVFKNRPRLPG